ncbi:hypothetical protein FZW96_13160 [Bacillus sp. BGMRC 2118]|nr:hypothetical protein FZW96_13160 [Bacillus sp. BGMRC 2118]
MAIEKKTVRLSDLLSFIIAFIILNIIDIHQYDLHKIFAILLLFIILFSVFYATNKVFKWLLGSRDKVVGFSYFIVACIVIATIGTFM